MKCPRPAVLVGLSSLALVFAVACGGEGNTGRVTPPHELREQIPWVNGVPPLLDDNGEVIMSEVPVYPDIATGLEDPGSSEPNQSSGDAIARGCAAAAEVEFASAWMETFESRDGKLPVGLAWAGYDDGSANSFRTPGFFNWYQYPELTLTEIPAGFGLPADRINDGPACDDEFNLFALHFKGGRFNRYGAGIDHPLGLALPCPTNADGSRSDLCAPVPEDGDEIDSAGLPLLPLDEDGNPKVDGVGRPLDYKQPHVFWDLSSYDGIAFWARRGPEGQETMLVKVQDKYTSDDLARENQKYCKRLRPCSFECKNDERCRPDPSGDFRCFPGPEDQYPGKIDDKALDSGLEDLIFPRCGESACKSPTVYLDPDFVNATCEPYTFSSNHESGEFCVNPGETPAAPEERCGDGPGTTVQLTTDWQFYKVPFSELRQLGFAQESPRLDRKSIAMISFIFTVGWVDTYLDNVTFYRERD